MDLENNQWNIADEEFSLWLNGNKHDGNLSITEILKSTYLIFRKKQRIRLETFCNKSFDYFLKREKEKLADSLKYKFERVMFSRCSDPESLLRMAKERKERNDKIINGILSGDQRVFNDLYEYEFPKVVRLITKNSGNIDSAKDIFQDALVILIEKVNRMELDLTCSVETYLYSICRILWLEQLRKD